MRRLLVATDNSDSAHRAVEVAASLAQVTGAVLIIVNVEQGYFDPKLGQIGPNDNIADILEARSREILLRAKELAQAMGAERIQTVSGLGDAAAFILDVAKRENVDMIVVGKRGRSRMTGLLLGSVSQHIVNLATCSVQVVP